jgi:hypothetical protein
MDAVILPTLLKRGPPRPKKIKSEPDSTTVILQVKNEPLEEDDKVKLEFLRNKVGVGTGEAQS